MTAESDTTARNIILNALKNKEFTPQELLDFVKNRGFNDSLVRQVVWQLLDSRQIRVTPNRRFAALK